MANEHDQPPPVSPPPPPPSMRSIPMLLPVFILIFFLICFFSIFLLRDLLHFLNSSRFRNQNRNRTSAGNAEGANQNGDPGLEPAIISSFPTLPFSSVRQIQEGKCGADCAVCLGEFGSEDVIRLLTVCCHAFHPACIDSWLASHTTCPMCRSDLHAPPTEEAMLAVQEAVGGSSHSHVIAIVDVEEPKSNSPIHSMESVREKTGEYSEDNGVCREACPQV